MRKLLWTALLLAHSAFGQDIRFSGYWQGTLVFGGNEMDIHVILEKAESGWHGTLSSEKQQLNRIQVSQIRVTEDSLVFNVPLAGGQWSGHLSKGELTGNWKQGPYSLPLNFTRRDEVPDLSIREREQTPKPPFPYEEREIVITNPRDGVKLAGTLTLPRGEGPFPAAILLSVAGPNDRDQSHGAPLHKPFKVLADFLTKNGIAIMRLDDRGVGGSTGNLLQSNIEDFAHDANAAFSFLASMPKIDPDRIGFIGNSEGSLVGPLAASYNGHTAFIITLGGIGIRGEEVILQQIRALGQISNISDDQIKASLERTKKLFTIVTSERDSTKIAKQVWELTEGIRNQPLSIMVPESREEMVKLFTSQWYIYQVKYDPSPILKGLTCPFLALHGSNDPFVAADENLQAIGEHLSAAGNRNYALIKLKNVNHVFQDSEVGSPIAYTTNEISFSPRAMEIILSWLKISLQ